MSEKIIHIIGVGGIGSYLCRSLYQVIEKGQLYSKDPYTITVYDDDEVEQKNLLYQDFSQEDLFSSKAVTISSRYKFNSLEIRVTSITPLIKSPEDIVICCVDNPEAREMIYREMESLPNIWIDLRSHGRHIAMYVKSEKNNLDFMKSTLPKVVDPEAGSCQLKHELTKGIIQLGNVIIANIGVQTLLNIHRKSPYSSRFVHEF